MNLQACVRTADSEHTTCVPWSKTRCLVPRSQLKRAEHAASPPMLKARGPQQQTSFPVTATPISGWPEALEGSGL